MNDLIRKLSRYLFTGGIAAVIDVGAYFLLIRSHTPIIPAAAASFCIANVFNFLLTSRFVFGQQSSPHKYPLFFLGALIGLMVNVGTTAVGATYLLMPAIIAKCFGICVAFLVNFFVNVNLVFRQKHRRPFWSAFTTTLLNRNSNTD